MDDIDLSNDLQRVISNIMTKCRSLIKMINKSSNLTTYMDQLKVVHKVRRGLSIDCKSRWDSTKFMMENLLLFKRLIVQLHSDKHDLSLNSKQKQKLTSLELPSDEWRMVSSIDHVLTPFYNATKLMSGQQYCTIGTALFAVRKMKSFLETIIENDSFTDGMKNDLLDQLVKYIDDDVDQLDLIVVSSFVYTYLAAYACSSCYRISIHWGSLCWINESEQLRSDESNSCGKISLVIQRTVLAKRIHHRSSHRHQHHLLHLRHLRLLRILQQWANLYSRRSSVLFRFIKLQGTQRPIIPIRLSTNLVCTSP